MNTAIVTLLGVGLLASSMSIASNHDMTDDLLLDDDMDFLAADAFEVVFAAEKPPSLLRTLGFSVQETLGWSKNNAALFTHQTTANAKWAGGLSPSWYLEWDASAAAQWPVTPLMATSETSTASEFNINTLYVQYSVGPISAKVGHYSIGWGELEGAGVLDIINPAPDLTQGNPSAGDNGQWLASGRFYGDQWELSGFYTIDPELTDMSAAGFPAPTIEDPEWGLRLGTQISGSDVSLYVGQFVEDTPILDLMTTSTAANSYALVGIAANKAVGNWLFKTDIAKKSGLSLYSNAAPTLTKSFDRVDYGVGVEYNATSGQQYGATVYGRQWRDMDGVSGALALSMIAPPAITPAMDMEAGAMLRFSDSYLNDDLSFTLMSTGDLSGAMVMLSTAWGYRVNDQWSGELNLTTAKANADSMYAAFDGEVLAVFSVKWQY